MNNNMHEIISLLADGESRSGQEIGDLLKITRSAVWKIMHKLVELGIPVERQQGKGYRFTRPVQILQKERIWEGLSPNIQEQIPDFDLADCIESTNDHLLTQIKYGKPSGSLVLCEHQTAGRGRLGRSWHSPYAANLYLSVYWHFKKDTSELSGLSQVATLAILRALSKHNVPGISLKWPNNIYYGDKKIAAVLIDMLAESHSNTDAVIGIGLNLSMSLPDGTIDQPWTDVHTITNIFPDRNHMASTLLEELYTALMTFEEKGFTVFFDEWKQHDGLAGKTVLASNPSQSFSGIAHGIGSQGELLIETPQGIIPLFSGSVNVSP